MYRINLTRPMDSLTPRADVPTVKKRFYKKKKHKKFFVPMGSFKNPQEAQIEA